MKVRSIVHRLVAAAAALGLASLSSAGQSSQAPNGVPSAILKSLTRGVNVTRWFCYCDAHDSARFKNYLIDADFSKFKEIGVKFVRLCISPEVIFRNGDVDQENLAYIDASIERLNRAGLLVLWDLHDNGQLKLDEPGHDNKPFVKFWSAVAAHYAGKNENRLVFELLNEPIFQKNPEVWYQLQEKTVKAVRAIDPNRTILAASTSWNGIDTLTAMTPLSEKNIIYSFHCYDPFVFTHQGATWTGDQQKALKGVPFPSSPESVAKMIDQIPEQYRPAVRDYGNHRYDAKYLYDRLSAGMQWGARNRVPVVLGEFGAYPPVSPPESRANWFDAMAAAIAALNLPNALWGYDDGLGLGREASGSEVKLDVLVMSHLYSKQP